MAGFGVYSPIIPSVSQLFFASILVFLARSIWRFATLRFPAGDMRLRRPRQPRTTHTTEAVVPNAMIHDSIMCGVPLGGSVSTININQ